MVGPARFSLKRLCAMLCVALALVFAGASTASAINRIQHQPGAPTAHEHVAFSTVLLDDDHHGVDHQADHGDTDDHDGNDSADHQPGPGHHHHGDTGPGLPAFASTQTLATGFGAGWHGLTRDRAPPGQSSYGPERPPKHRTTSV